jgi:hypothetical protein
MMPWAKESTRRHLVAYTRGIVFHVAVFGAFALLLVSPWIRQWHETIRFVAASGLALGALAALGGYWIRASDEAVRAVSTPDDYFSLGLVTAFIASAALACVVEPAIPGLWAISGIVIAYIPISKLKHSIYFFYTRTLFGAFFGYRGVLKISRRSS